MNRLELQQNTEQVTEHVSMEDLQAKYKSTKLTKQDFYKRVYVNSIRCDRLRRAWRFTMADGTYRYATDVVINRGAMSCRMNNEKGCGLSTDFIGEASGHIVLSKGLAYAVEKTTQFLRLGNVGRKDSTNSSGWRRLEFDKMTGVFSDAETGKEITTFKKLHLMENCSARYIP